MDFMRANSQELVKYFGRASESWSSTKREEFERERRDSRGVGVVVGPVQKKRCGTTSVVVTIPSTVNSASEEKTMIGGNKVCSHSAARLNKVKFDEVLS